LTAFVGGEADYGITSQKRQKLFVVGFSEYILHFHPKTMTDFFLGNIEQTQTMLNPEKRYGGS